MKKLLILGQPNTGTSLLAALLGSHSDVGILFEDTTNQSEKIYGKSIVGNKLLLWHQIRWAWRATKLEYLINRVLNFGRKRQIRFCPSSRKSICDHISEGYKIFVITRNVEEVRRSNMRRQEWLKPEWLRRYYFDLVYNAGIRIIEKLIISDADMMLVEYSFLTNEPGQCLRRICQWLDIEYEAGMLEGVKKNWHYQKDEIIPNS